MWECTKGKFNAKVQDWGWNPVRRALATASPDWENGFPTENRHNLWCHAGREDCFLNPFVHRSKAVAHPEPTKVFLNRARDGHAVCTLQVHSPTSLVPGRFFAILRTKIPFRQNEKSGRARLPTSLIQPFSAEAELFPTLLQEVTSQDEIFMPDISGYTSGKGLINSPPGLRSRTCEVNICYSILTRQFADTEQTCTLVQNL